MKAPPRLSNQAIHVAVLYWLLDAMAAVIFACGLALLIGGWQDGPAGLVPLAMMVMAAIGRGALVMQAVQSGLQGAARIKHGLRSRLLPLLVASAPRRGGLRGEDGYILLDAVESLDGYMASYRPLRAVAAVAPFIVIAAVAFASWVAAAIMLATLLPFAVGMALAGMAAAEETRRQQLALERMGSLFGDRVRNLPLIYAYARDDRLVRHLHAAASEVAERTLQVLRLAFLSSAVLEFFAALAVALVAVYCGFSLLGLLPFAAPETLTLTEAMFALALAPEVYLSMRRLAIAYHDKQQGEAALDHIDRERTAAAAMAAPVVADSGFLPGWVELDRLRVVYADGTGIGPVSHRFDGTGLHLITGPSGSGKSSLLAALVGMAPVAQGAINVDGMPCADAALSCGWAGQRTLLLPGSLRDTLLVGPGRDLDDRVNGLFERLGLSPLLARRGGLDMLIDARGSGLSGGERRRIGLARALLSDRPLLLLDEPTADLDANAAAAVLDEIHHHARTRMIIAATHDPALKARCRSQLVLP